MIETKRLFIKPLTHNQLLKYVKNDNSLETELNLDRVTKSISPELKEALENTLLPNVADTSKNYLFSTLWSLIHKDRNVMVGDICFCGEPNDKQEVEIGYGTYEEFRGNGFMTEAVAGIIGWAKNQLKINTIIASTDKTNIASYTILEKNGFIKIDEDENLFKWTLSILKCDL